MSKNDALADTAVSLVSCTKDENFKDIVRYKAIAALIVKLTIPEFKDKTLVEIAKQIIDLKHRNEKNTDASILEDEVDFLDNEAGTKDEKNTINDAIFQIRTNDGISNIRLENILDKVTVNAEMQNITSENVLGYNLISRAVYYGASLLRSTVPAGDTKYSNIHKVYSIWFCNGNIKFDIDYNELKNEYIHRYGMRRFYSDIENQVVKAEKSSDLMEIVLVELKKLKEHLDSDTERLVYNLFYNTGNIVDQIESIEKVNLTKVKKGVKDMIDYEARTQARVNEAEKATEVNTAVTFLSRQQSKGKKFTLEQAIKIIMDNLGYTKEIAETAYKMVQG